jgi:hypothetical protein
MSGNLRVVDGIEDSIHGRYVMIASGPRKIWRAIEDFAENAVFKDLTRQGITVVTDKAKRDLREKVQGWTSFRKGYVATQPGWYGRHFVMPDGRCWPKLKPKGEDLVIAFQPNPKAHQRGTLKEYRSAIKPIVKGQSLCLSMIAYSLAPILIDVVRETPYAVDTTGLDVVAPPKFGKTTLLGLTGAQHGGESSRRGYCESWSDTEEAHAERFGFYNASFAGYDETGTSKGESLERKFTGVFNKVMRMHDAKPRARFGDTRPYIPTTVFYASTGNCSVRRALQTLGAELPDAVVTRMFTIDIGARPHGIFDFTPIGFKTDQEAANELSSGIQRQYGSLGRIFAKRVVNARAKNKQAFQEKVVALMELFMGKARHEFADIPDRLLHPLALAYAAGRLLKEWRVFGKGWGSFEKALLGLLRLAMASLAEQSAAIQGSPSCEDVIAKYAREHDLVDARGSKVVMTRSEIRSSAGIIHRQKAGHIELLIHPTQLAEKLPGHATILAALKAKKLLATEGTRRMTVKRMTISNDRLYAIRIRPESMTGSFGVPVPDHKLGSA